MSSFTEKLMAPGSWQLDFDPATPSDILDLSALAFSRIVITPAHIPATDADPDEIVAQARYVGLLRERTGRTRWGGPGLAALLGDEDGKGNTFAAAADDVDLPKYDGGNPSWILTKVLRDAGGGANGITAGDITSTGTPSKEGNIEVGDTPRDTLEWVCRVFSGDKTNPQEWRINPDGTLDQRNKETLWPTAVTPTAIAVRQGGASTHIADGSGLKLIPVVSFGTEGDWDDWSSATMAVGPEVELFGTPYTFTGRDEIADNPFVDIAGDPLVMERVVETNKSKSNADNEDIAARIQGRHENESRHIDFTVDLFDLAEVGQVGDTIWVFDLLDGLTNRSNLIWLAAEPVFPLAARIVEATSPVRDGHGAYLLWWTGSTFELTDVTDYVRPDDRPMRVGVGDPKRLLGLSRPSRRA